MKIKNVDKNQYILVLFKNLSQAIRKGMLLPLLLLLPSIVWAGIVENGNFEQIDADGNPVGWILPEEGQAELITEDGNSFVRLTNTDQQNLFIRATALLDTSWQEVRLSARVRISNLRKGDESWETARLSYHFADANGVQVDEWPMMPSVESDSDWQTISRTVSVPIGATQVILWPGFQNAAGVMDLDDIEVLGGEALTTAAPAFDAVDISDFNGSFQELDGDGKPLHWILPEGTQLLTEDGKQFVRIKSPEPGNAVVRHTLVAIPEEALGVTLEAAFRSPDLQKGDEGWQTARLSFDFVGADGKRVGGWPPYAVLESSAEEWQSLGREYPIPSGARALSIWPGFQDAGGTLDIADANITFRSAGPAEDAELPARLELSWDNEPIEQISRTRASICLNGYWKFQPSTDFSEKPMDKGWGYIQVPGSWLHLHNNGGIVAKGGGAIWARFGNESNLAWYRREIMVPKEWEGREIALELQRVSTEAVVFVDGQKVGEVDWPYGEVNLTDLVKPGQKQVLDILVVAAGDGQQVMNYMGHNPDQITAETVSLESKGITQDVFLHSRPLGGRVNSVFFKPSFRDGKLRMEIDLADSKAGEVEISAVFTMEEQEPRNFKASVTVPEKASHTVEVEWDWADAVLWDLEQPNLYTMTLEVSGPGIDDVYQERFGFRELWIEGRNFYLNGTRIRFRPMAANPYPEGNSARILARLAKLTSAGFNILHMWPYDTHMRGKLPFMENWATIADETGSLLIGRLPDFREFFGHEEFHEADSDLRREWQQRVDGELRRLRNHPSILMWGIAPNFFGHRQDQNPRFIGKNDWATGLPLHENVQKGKALLSDIKSMDGTRPVFAHHGTYTGDVYALNTYLNMIPQQERENWLSEWAEKGDMPFMSVEFGLPYGLTYHRGRMSGHTGPFPAKYTEPLMTEYFAWRVGNVAYDQELPRYRKGIAEAFQGGQRYGNLDGIKPSWAEIEFFSDQTTPQTWRAWRTWGVSGGMVAWGPGWYSFDTSAWHTMPPFAPGTRGPYLERVEKEVADYAGLSGTPRSWLWYRENLSTLAWIAGSEEEFTEKGHNFLEQSEASKQLAILNDTREVQVATWKWSAQIEGEPLESDTGQISLEPGTTAFVPIKFSTPKASAPRVQGLIEAQVEIAGGSLKDSFEFKLFAKPAFEKVAPIALIDESGLTKGLFNAVGVEHVEQSPDLTPVNNSLLVIGRGSANEGSLKAAWDHAKAGGSVLVMAQDPEFLRNHLGLRVERLPERKMFPVRADHPIMRNLAADDLRDWRESGSLVEAYPEDQNTGYPAFGWRWGNRGTVATAPVEKPHLSGWTPILESGFDLAYTPLMELSVGKGRVIWSSLDLEDQAPTDGAALRLLNNLLEYASTPPSMEVRVLTIYRGNQVWRDRLIEIGVILEPDKTPIGDGKLLILGEDYGLGEAEIEAFVSRGGRLLVLPQGNEAWPLGVLASKSEGFSGSSDIPQWPEAAGLSRSDLRTRVDVATWLFTDGAEIGADGLLARRSIGDGLALFTQLNPWELGADEKTYLRLTRWRQTRAISQVLANMGASLSSDKRLFFPDRDRKMMLAGEWRMKPGRLIETYMIEEDFGVTAAAKEMLHSDEAFTGGEVVEFPGLLPIFSDKVGEVLVQRTFDVPKEWANDRWVLSLGPVDDLDITAINGVVVGSTDATIDNYWRHSRVYDVPSGVVKAGRNVLTVRVFDLRGDAGVGSIADLMFLRSKDQTDSMLLYHPDYSVDFQLGDDPARYYQW